MTTETGYLVDVTVRTAGSALAAPVLTGSLTVPLVNADDFVAPCLVEIDEATYLVNEVTDDDELVLDPTTPILADVDEDSQAYSLSRPGTRQIEWFVLVEVEGEEDPRKAVIPPGLRGFFREGDADAGALVEIRSERDGYVAVGRIVDRDEISGIPLRTSDTGARVEIETTTNFFESSQEWGLIRFYNSDDNWAPALIWATFDPTATPDLGKLRLSSPYYGTDWGDAAVLELTSDESGASRMDMISDRFYFGSGGSSVDLNLAFTNQFSFRNPGGSRINFGYQFGYNVIVARDSAANLMRLRLQGSDLDFDFAGERLYMMQATGVARAILAHEDLSVALMWGDSGQLRVTNATGTNFNPIEASAFTVSSDGMNKSREVPLEGALDAVRQWQPKDYETTQGAPEGETVPGRGFIAQEMAEVTPELVKPDEGDGSGLKIDVMGTVATLAAAVKELTAKVDALEARVAELEQ